MKLKAFLMLALLCTVAQGVWAQNLTYVSDETSLRRAITDGAENIHLTANITLNDYLNIGSGVNVTIDLAGYSLGRSLNDYSYDGHVIFANGCNLTLTSSAAGGSIEGGMANTGGGIMISAGATVTATYVTFQNNSAADHAGAVWNNGTFEATDCTFKNNRASDVGAIYNSVSADGAGTATLTRCTFTGNVGTTGAGALANALDATEMTIEDCTIQNNTAGSRGGGIWNGGTLNIKGAITVQGNTKAGGEASNVFLKTGKVITVTGDLTGSSICMDLESLSGTFTSGYKTYHDGVAPSTFFTADHSDIGNMELDDGEVCLTPDDTTPVSYIERSWDETNKVVVSTEKTIKGIKIGYDTAPAKGQYKEVTNAPSDEPNQWFGMGGYSDDVAEFYVVRGEVNRETIVVQGSDVHLILCDGATLTLTGGLKLEGDNKLYIHCQSYGGDMGRLIVTNKYESAAGIGSAQDNGVGKTVGELVIYGGHIEATGGEDAAGIGSCSDNLDKKNQLCKSVIVYGGYVKATGGEHAAGIGGGKGVNGGVFILYDGTVNAKGGCVTSLNFIYLDEYYTDGGAGIGGGYYGYGGNVTVYGGTLTASGNTGGAGIGSAMLAATVDEAQQLRGGTFTMYAGTVKAIGADAAAGIGGGLNSGGAEVFIYGGTVTATGGDCGAGIGSGNARYGKGGNVTISGGTVTAKGGESGAGIGGGLNCYGAIVNISGGTVTATGGKKGAGIGGGEINREDFNGNGGTVNISGGTVTATGGEKGAGIGGGYKCGGGDVTITGGTVIAKAGEQEDAFCRAIGPGNENDSFGTLTIGDMIMVGAGNNGSVERIMDADERVNGCWYRSYAEISPCTHPSGITYTINEDGTHTSHCKHCGVSEKAAHFDNDGNGQCICGYMNGENYCTITIATNDGFSYSGVDVFVGKNKPYTLPMCTVFPDGYDFAGWVVNPESHENGILPNEGETLLQAGENITVTADVTIFARYQPLAISLADGSDNGEMLYTYNGRKAASVTLTGRTLYKDGKWNTLCLPFDLIAEQIAESPLAGADIRTLSSASFSNNTLTLTFTAEGTVTSITAGTPYIIKWAGGSNIAEPTFSDVTISNSYNPVETDSVDFVGTYAPIDIYTEENTNLYLGDGDKLFYPKGEGMTSFTINAFRAYFQLKNGITAGEPTSTAEGIKAFVLNFGEEETVMGYGLLVIGYGDGNGDGWFTLDGRRLGSKPGDAGLYIHRGRKVMIK